MASETRDKARGRGCVLILSNPLRGENSPNQEHTRDMARLWRDTIGCHLFENQIHIDVTGERMEQLFSRLAGSTDAARFDYLVVVIMADGGLVKTKDDEICLFVSGSDKMLVSEEAIFHSFANHNTNWVHKPKFFVLCHSRLDRLPMTHAGNNVIRSKPVVYVSPNEKDEVDATGMHPMRSDFLLVYGTSTQIITEISNAFSAESVTETAITKLMKVNAAMRRSGHMSIFESSLSDMFWCPTVPDNNVAKHDAHVDREGCDRVSPAKGRVLIICNGLDNGSKTSAKADPSAGEVETYSQSADSAIERYLLQSYSMNALVKWVLEQEKPKAEQLKISHTKEYHFRLMVICHLKSFLDPNTPGKTIAEVTTKVPSHLKDQYMMYNLWQKNLNCNVTSLVNQTADEMKNALEKISKEDAEDFDYLVVVISSHGGLRQIKVNSFEAWSLRPIACGIDREAVDEREVLSSFDKPNSPWCKKHKLFILDYCRGEGYDKGANAVSKAKYISFPPNNDILTPAVPYMVQNCFLLYAAHAEYMAYSNYLIGAVSEIFSEHWRKKSVAEMLTLVNAKMKNPDRDRKAMSVFKCTAEEDLYLHKPFVQQH